MSELKDMVGQKYNMLTVVSRAENSKSGKARWNCLCDCGKTTIVTGSNLRNGAVKSCGCRSSIVTATRSTTHGKSQTRLYGIWASMKSRCTNPKIPDYRNYGMRGISVCQEWAKSFEKFYAWAVSNGYSDELTIDRIDNNGNYCPENCRWSSKKEQDNNRRRCLLFEYHGKTQNLTQWCEELGIDYKLTHNRIFKSKMTFEQAISMPLMKSRSHKKE